MRRVPVLLPLLAVLLLALLGAARLPGVVAQDASPAASPAATPAVGTPRSGTPAAGTPTSAEAVTVEIRDFAFEPPTLEIAAGTTVTWTNRDATAHTVVDDGTAFASESLGEGETFSYTYEEAGSFPYHCGFHPFMTATVVVG